jgi:hypothetical protein
VARENSIVDIEAYRDRHGKTYVCPVCEGDGSKECDVETTTGTVKQYDGPCDRCGGTGLARPNTKEENRLEMLQAMDADNDPTATTHLHNP